MIASLYERFTNALTQAGWTSEPSGSGMRHGKDRCVIALALREGAIVWTVFPTPPQLRPGVVTKPHPIPLVTFTLQHQQGQAIDAWSHVVDRSGALVKKPFFSGDLAAVFDRLLRESTEAVDVFVRDVEQTP